MRKCAQSYCGLLLLLQLYSLSAASEWIVHVDHENGRDSQECLKGSSPQNSTITPCKSLDYVVSHLRNNMTIVIQSDLWPKGLQSFANRSWLKILGGGGKRVLSGFDSSTNTTTPCGLEFRNITNLEIFGIVLSQCGATATFKNKTKRIVSLHVKDSTNVTITDIMIANTNGTGLLLSDMEGLGTIRNCSFVNNSHNRSNTKNNIFAGGIHAQFSKNKFETKTNLTVTKCVFENNKQPTIRVAPRDSYIKPPNFEYLYGSGMGGGMSLLFLDTSQGVNVMVERCRFAFNKAHFGGGLYAHFEMHTTKNSLTIMGSTFERNSGLVGGGMMLGYAQLQLLNKMAESVTFNNAFVLDTVFVNNTAKYGGGCSVFAIHSVIYSRQRQQMLNFTNCTWSQNSAHYSSAIDISPFQYDRYIQGFLPSPVFCNCTFTGNLIHPGRQRFTQYVNSGIVVVTGFEVHFMGKNIFQRNRYTAMRLTSATILLKRDTEMLFHGNEGLKGGALAMYGFSALKGTVNCSLVFTNNSASEVGGAIYYQPFEQREFIDGKSCFLQYIGQPVEDRNQSPSFYFTFANNSAIMGGSSIYASSFYSCFYAYLANMRDANLTDFFEKIGQFDFGGDESDDSRTPALATEGSLFVSDLEGKEEGWLFAAPGEPIHIPLAIWDEFNRIVHMPVGMEVKKLVVGTDKEGLTTETSRNLSSESPFLAANTTKIYGESGNKVNLVFRTQNIREAYYTHINVTLLDCPPGYHFYPDNHTCKCSAEKESTTYKGIHKCDDSKFRAYIKRDYWAGFHEKQLYTAPCSFELCAINSVPKNHHLLPSSNGSLPSSNGSHHLLSSGNDDTGNTVERQLDKMMCGKYKKGILCGTCGDHFSSYLHSPSHKCGSEDLCHLGPLFYLLSELLPVVLLFALIINFNISLTAAGMSGFVFFSQMVTVIPVDVEKTLYNHSDSTKQAFRSFQTGYTMLYNVLNFDFFTADFLSFCLWNSAKAMDTLATKYITTGLTLVLLYFLYTFMNSRWYMRRRNSRKKSVVHGLSAFLLLTFSQCASVSFKILSRNAIQSYETAPKKEILVTHHGGLLYFGPSHRVYAVTAILVLVFLVVLPPLLLLLYPLTLQLLSWCGLSEHWVTKAVLNTARIHRLNPLFDAFQSCFKDRLRFFAGLYFVYKVIMLFCLSFTNNLIQFFTTSTVLIFLMLSVHAVAQPYKERVGNVVDACLFLNLGIIGGLNMYSSMLVSSTNGHYLGWITVLVAAQMAFTYLPIFVAMIWCVVVLVRRRRRRRRGRREGYQRLDSLHDGPGNEGEETEEEEEVIVKRKEEHKKDFTNT